MTESPLRVWPGAAPGTETWAHLEEESVIPDTGMFVIRNVVTPTLTPVLPNQPNPAGPAVVVAPGGAFAALAWHHEGTATAHWFAERGVAAFVLKYRLNPFFGDDGPDEVAEPMPHPRDAVAMRAWLQRLAGRAPDLGTADAEQAIRVLRKQSDAWGIDPERIGIIGFSAGGTIATQAAATSDPTARPNFVVNIYGAYCNREVPPQAPPYFGVVAADDELCLGFFLDTTRQWLDAGAPTEFHVYETGGHGFGLVPQGTPVDTWTDRLEDWLAARGVLVHGTVAAARS